MVYQGICGIYHTQLYPLRPKDRPDHHFSGDLFGKKVATWTSPGDFGNVRGIFTPDWWYPNWNQYGLLKILVINKRGTFIDGLQVSDVSINDFDFDYHSTIKLRLEVEEDAEHIGGLTIFGKTFGNYNQDIDVRINYSPIAETPTQE